MIAAAFAALAGAGALAFVALHRGPPQQAVTPPHVIDAPQPLAAPPVDAAVVVDAPPPVDASTPLDARAQPHTTHTVTPHAHPRADAGATPAAVDAGMPSIDFAH